MKYAYSESRIPQNRRADINDKILRVIDAGSDIISREDIYNAYTGDGGLHGLKLSDFANFTEYTKAKQSIENGQFFTSHHLCQFVVDSIRPSADDLVADLTCGKGNFFNFLPNEQNVYGNEYDIKAVKVARYLYPNAHITCDDVRYFRPEQRFDVIFGNPPFNLDWGDYKSQMFYCIRAEELLRPGGLLALIMPMSFLADEFMDDGAIRLMNERFNFIAQMKLDAGAFRQFGADHVETKFMVFQKRSEHIVHWEYNAKEFVDEVLGDISAREFHETFIAPLLAEKERLRYKLFFESKSADREAIEFNYKVRKLLFDIKRNPLINNKYARAVEYVERYHTQEKPEGMETIEWEKRKITPAKVLSYLRRIVDNQHEIERDEIRLVKTNYGLRLKGYSAKTRRQLKKNYGTTEVSFVDLVIEGADSDNGWYPFEDQTYRKLVSNKVKGYNRQSQKLKDMGDDPEAGAYLNTFTLYDSSQGKTIRLNDMQKADISLFMRKKYGILNWQMGSGKTLAGITWMRYLLDTKRIRNAFVVSAALAINLTWKQKLTDYDQKFILIRSLKDIYNIQPGQIVLVTLNMLVKYKKQIQKFVRMQSQKVGLLVDESDELTNHKSKRTKATLSCFRRAHYKLLTTGTTTRNNIIELYAQLELLYNNSVNMLCECETVYKANKDGEIVEFDNDYYMAPFPARGGQSVWKSCHCPSKATVFGIRKFNQDIYNKDALVNIIEKTVITRKFEEISGEKKYQIVTHRIAQNEAERDVYLKIMNEFYRLVNNYFRSTGNSRKDSMLTLVRQIQLMIKSTSIPHLFGEYAGAGLPSKFLHILDLVRQFNEKVAIGTVFIDTAEEYSRILSEAFPERQVFLIKGDVSFKQRGRIIREFESTENGILVSTQMSLKSSVNIPSCNKVILESLQWNIPKISQFYFRFIRFDSKQLTDVHFVTYDYTIEQNLLALLMTKERINEFIKTLEFQDEADIFSEYDIDTSLLDAVIEREKDETGNVRLTWGQQKAV